jgi:conjugative relaxase-like TrwC/TraI family protein
MMTVHVLHAGDGYTYLTRQVAAGDESRTRGDSLSDYYAVDGNPPGRWIGSGLAGLDVSGLVDEAQMKALFGEGRHPDAERLERALIAGGASPAEAMKTTQLGRRFPRFEAPDDDPYEPRMREAYAQFRADFDRSPEVGVERDLVRWNVATGILAEKKQGVAPSDADVARYLAGRGAAQRQPVAGYDLVFTPAKSISTLWGLGNDDVRRGVEQSHEAAWRQTIGWLESEAALTRVGAGGPAQVNTKGFVATAFDHMDSRTGDPNLHTHVAISNKVQGEDGQWRALDGRVMHALGVAASERYGTAVESQLRERLGVVCAEEKRGRARQGVREVEGISREVRDSFSGRRAAIEVAYADLVAAYRAQHGHEPAKAVQYAFAQQATLSTRQAKEEGVPLSVRRAQWRERAASVLGSEQAVDEMVAGALHPAPRIVSAAPDLATEDLTREVLESLAESRSVWTVGNVAAEAQRVARTHGADVAGLDIVGLADDLTRQALRRSVSLTPPDLNPVPGSLQRADGESVYLVHAAERWTSVALLQAEDRLVGAAQQVGGLVVSDADLTRAAAAVEAETGRSLNAGQLALARRFSAGGHLIEAGIGPAGAGKTTSMSVVARAVKLGGGRVLGLAPSAAAAAVLGDELGIGADTLHKILHAYAPETTASVPDRLVVDAATVLLVDEAGMAGTPELDRLLALAAERGAAVRLLGDPAQLQAIGAGGVLRLIDIQVGAAHLEDVHRFSTDGEAAASLRVREGHKDGLDFYVDANRCDGGTREAMADDLYAAWWNDTQAGKASTMIAASNDDVVRLSARARLDRVAAGDVEAGGVQLHNDAIAGTGDTIVTRSNARLLRMTRGTDFVKNGDLWTVTERHDDGSLRVQSTTHRGCVTLPAAYVAENVELGYATTIHRVQGMTVDTAHYLVAGGATREQLYTGMTRGRERNQLYVVTDELLEVDAHEQVAPSRAVRQSLEAVLSRAETTPSATATLDAEYDRAASLAKIVPEYEDAHARVLDPGRDERIAAAVREALGDDIADDVLDDDAWPTLRDRLAAHEHAGVDVETLVRTSAADRELDTADSVAQVLHHRIGEAPASDSAPDGRGLPAWITPAPDDSTRVDPEVDPAAYTWVAAHADLISTRLDELVDQAERNGPEWTRTLVATPTDPIEAEQWRSQVRRIVAYRDRYDIADPAPVPQASARGIEETARTDAQAAYVAVRSDASAPAGDADPEVARVQQRTVTQARLGDLNRRVQALTAQHNAETLTERVRRLREQSPQPQQSPIEPTRGPERPGPQM